MWMMGCLTEWLIKLLITFVKANNLCFVLPHREEANLVQIVIISSVSNTTKLKDCCKNRNGIQEEHTVSLKELTSSPSSTHLTQKWKNYRESS